MARKPRLHVPGGVYHMILRGNGGQDIFFEDENRYHVYGLLHQGGERSRHRLLGFCCMTNHRHLAIQVKETPLSQIMHNLSFRYTRWNNHKHTCGVATCFKGAITPFSWRPTRIWWRWCGRFISIRYAPASCQIQRTIRGAVIERTWARRSSRGSVRTEF